MSNLLEPIVQAVVSLVGALGAPGVGIAVAAENLFPPIPSEVILPSAGFAAASGSMGLVSAIVWATVGSVVGALALYALGAWFGRARFYSLASKIPFVKEADIQRAEAWFVRRGPLAVLLGRVVPVVRSLISIPAGIERMKLLPFTLYTAIGSGLWNSVLIGAGYALGANWEIVEEWISRYQLIVFGLAGIALVVWMVRKWTARRSRESAVKAGHLSENVRKASSIS
ncbi:DedA family protein [uncultured Actinomyces sp.]|uniref:DedA family protein n=1 Tax=uncultured Actinomyces sp. TaxID=249061 RepID=UPI0028E2D811|nr:DedA family protein [uncultured Actinomyces sp.]